jgi:hypothetical protein
MIQYYCTIFVSGNPPGLRETSVLAVHPNSKFPLVLSNGEGLPSTITDKRINVIWHNRLMDQCGIFWAINWFQLKKRGCATAADGIYMQMGCLKGIMKKHITNEIKKAKADEFAPGDMLSNKFNSGDKQSVAAILGAIKSKKSPLSEDTAIDDKCTLNTREYVFPDKSESEAIAILRSYGTVHVIGHGIMAGNIA